MDEIQRNRKELIQRVCADLKPGATDYHISHTSPQLVYNDEYQFAYCRIPKAGTTNWRRILLVLKGAVDNLKDVHHVNVGRNAYPRISLADIDKRRCISFLFVRHPFQRLLSAYRSKLENPDRHAMEKRIGVEILSKFRENASTPIINSGKSVTFYEFVQFVLSSKKTSGFNEHWDYQHKLCSVCEHSYDFIGHVENIVEESNYLLHSIGVTNVNFPEYSYHATNSSDENVYFKYFSQIPTEDIIKLYELYKMDFKLFGYAFPKELI
ncbi:carbohydrate sulfotransferase 11-like [Saccoglossus kowalevskii]|uniref:Carbohydrate sulfotransferase n=1 Tax=Saccoglossus kowalevskii TaxID=10224 RepID=A0ABM0LUQ6_SACKO|nr:PREDICTED: carbohydrate sulfotransferase 11-like [Saccoglossus kowalevskii]